MLHRGRLSVDQIEPQSTTPSKRAERIYEVHDMRISPRSAISAAAILSTAGKVGPEKNRREQRYHRKIMLSMCPVSMCPSSEVRLTAWACGMGPACLDAVSNRSARLQIVLPHLVLLSLSNSNRQGGHGLAAVAK